MWVAFIQEVTFYNPETQKEIGEEEKALSTSSQKATWPKRELPRLLVSEVNGKLDSISSGRVLFEHFVAAAILKWLQNWRSQLKIRPFCYFNHFWCNVTKPFSKIPTTNNDKMLRARLYFNIINTQQSLCGFIFDVHNINKLKQRLWHSW